MNESGPRSYLGRKSLRTTISSRPQTIPVPSTVAIIRESLGGMVFQVLHGVYPAKRPVHVCSERDRPSNIFWYEIPIMF